MAARQIYIVDAWIVDANGTFNNLQGFPARFDSRSYDFDSEKARRRAEGKMAEAWGGMCKVDTRQVQTVTLATADGFQLDRKTMGHMEEAELVINQEPEEPSSD